MSFKEPLKTTNHCQPSPESSCSPSTRRVVALGSDSKDAPSVCPYIDAFSGLDDQDVFPCRNLAGACTSGGVCPGDDNICGKKVDESFSHNGSIDTITRVGIFELSLTLTSGSLNLLYTDARAHQVYWHSRLASQTQPHPRTARVHGDRGGHHWSHTGDRPTCCQLGNVSVTNGRI